MRFWRPVRQTFILGIKCVDTSVVCASKEKNAEEKILILNVVCFKSLTKVLGKKHFDR